MPSDMFSDGFAITSRQVADNVVVVAISGDLDIASVPTAKAFLAEATARGPEHLVLDLTGVDFLGSSGLALLIAARANDDDIHGYLHLLGVTGNRAVERPLAAVALLDLFDIAATLDALLADLDAVHPSTD